MSPYRLLPAAARPAQSWKNGGGVTREVIVHPPGAGMDDFLWRVSIADVEREGDFSLFPGIDRVMAILSGKLELQVESQTTVLDTRSEPLPFPGDVASFGRPLGGPVRDVNLMTRRGQAQAAMQRLPGLNMVTSAPTTLLLAEAAMPLSIDGECLDLAPLDAVLVAPGHAMVAQGSLLLITLDTVDTP